MLQGPAPEPERVTGESPRVDPTSGKGQLSCHPPPLATPMRLPASQLLQIVTLSLGLIACAGREPASEQRITVVALPSPTGPNAAEPFVSYSDKNTLILSWLQRDADSSSVTMRVASMDSSNHWTAPAEVVRATNLFVNWADFPSVVPLASGKLLAHWLQKNGSGRYSYDIRLAESSDGGATWSKSITPHGEGIPAEHGFVTLLPRADSSADVVFLNGSPAPAAGDGHGEHGPAMRLAFARYDKSGAMAGPEAILDQRTCDCCQTAAAQTAQGPVILYRDRSEAENRDISVQRLVDGTWTPATPLHADGWTINACPVNGPAISAIGNTVAAVWFTGARDTAKVQLVFSSDAGATFGKPVRIDGGAPAGRVDVELLDNGDALVTWIEQVGEKRSEIRARLVRADGTAESPVTLVAVNGGRASGFPRMVRRRNDIVLAWTVPGVQSAVQLAALRIAPR